MRSLLFVPADSEKKMAKGAVCGADALIIDLEDSVAAPNKPGARKLAAAFLAEMRRKPTRPRLYVRINPIDTAYWQDDLAGVMAAAPDGLLQPKPRSGADVDALSAALDVAEREHGLAAGSTRLLALAPEIPLTLINMHTFVATSARLDGLTWGAEDLSAVVGSQSTREANGRTWTGPYMLARNLCLMAAAAGGRQAIDTIYANFRDVEGMAEEARLAARDGFTAKMAIHPDQVAPINQAFTPSATEIAWAREVVAVFAANPDAGTLALRGQMLDRPHLVRAQRILLRAKAAGAI